MLLRVVVMGGRIRDRIVPVDYYTATPVSWDFSPHGKSMLVSSLQLYSPPKSIKLVCK